MEGRLEDGWMEVNSDDGLTTICAAELLVESPEGTHPPGCGM